MLALRFVLTALADIFRDFSRTLQVVLLPASLYWGVHVSGIYLAMSREISSPAIIVILFALTLFCAIWAGVNYHRRLLLGEGYGWQPIIHLREMLGYSLVLVPMALVVLVIEAVTQFLMLRAVMAMLGTSVDADDFYLHMETLIRANAGITILVGILSITLALRLLSLLPAIAIGEPMTDIFRGHRRVLPTLLLIAVIIVIVSVVPGWLAGIVVPALAAATEHSFDLIIMIVLSAVVQLFQVTFGLALITAIHGHYSGRRVLP